MPVSASMRKASTRLLASWKFDALRNILPALEASQLAQALQWQSRSSYSGDADAAVPNSPSDTNGELSTGAIESPVSRRPPTSGMREQMFQIWKSKQEEKKRELERQRAQEPPQANQDEQLPTKYPEQEATHAFG